MTATNEFACHVKTVTEAARVLAKELKIVGVDFHAKRDKYGVKIVSKHPSSCRCGECK